jgi:hypothetical protein
MIEEITLVNNTLNQSITLNKTSAAFLLADDDAIDWGTVQANVSSFSSSSRIGVGINTVSISTGRDISITGWVINDDLGTIEEKKQQLNCFCNPFDEITVFAGDYKIDGVFSQVVKYPTANKENNDIICKFLIYIFCPKPVFETNSVQVFSLTDTSQKLFTFPLEWVEGEKILFGLNENLSRITLNNIGTVATGFEAYLKIEKDLQGLTLLNVTNGQQFKIKESVTLEAGDVLYINTVQGSREVKIGDSEDNLENALDIFDLSSDFIQLTPGNNVIDISGSGVYGAVGGEIYVNPLFYAMEEQ